MPTYRFPHEDPDALPLAGKEEPVFDRELIRQAWNAMVYVTGCGRQRFFGGSLLGNVARMNVAYNGAKGADRLSNKQRFTDLVVALGYNAPKSLIIPEGTEGSRIADAMDDVLGEDCPVFCKPLDGTRGMGIHICENHDEAVAFLVRQHRDYLAQSVITPEADWRYIIHRDGWHLLSGTDDALWRIAYEKVRPSVIGNGESTVDELLAADTTIPRRAMRITQRGLLPDVRNAIPPEWEKVSLVRTGNISQGAYGKIPDAEELRNVDAFMAEFREKLERALGTRLATACFDIGIRDREVLRRKRGSGLKENIIFYESQIPFGYSGYIDAMPVPEPMGKWRRFPRLWDKYWRSRTAFRLAASMAYSGRVKIRGEA